MNSKKSTDSLGTYANQKLYALMANTMWVTHQLTAFVKTAQNAVQDFSKVPAQITMTAFVQNAWQDSTAR